MRMADRLLPLSLYGTSIEAHVPGYIRGQAQNLAEGRPARIPSVIPLMAQKRLGTPQPRDPGRLNNDAE
jgi:hypothetical protein